MKLKIGISTQSQFMDQNLLPNFNTLVGGTWVGWVQLPQVTPISVYLLLRGDLGIS